MKTVLITGGRSGIGARLASALHAQGAQVIIAGRTRDRLDAVAGRHPGMRVEVVDVAEADQVAALAERRCVADFSVRRGWPSIPSDPE